VRKSRKQLLDEVYWKMKDEALDRSMWRIGFERGCGSALFHRIDFGIGYGPVVFPRIGFGRGSG
jgi:hypothetical protein